MFNDLTGVAITIGVFAFVVVIISVMIATLSGNIGCPGQGPTNYTSWNSGLNLCYNNDNGIGLGNATPSGTSYTTSNYLLGTMGSTGGGLASWTYIIVIAAIGALIIGLLFRAFGGSNNVGRY